MSKGMYGPGGAQTQHVSMARLGVKQTGLPSRYPVTCGLCSAKLQRHDPMPVRREVGGRTRWVHYDCAVPPLCGQEDASWSGGPRCALSRDHAAEHRFQAL